MSAETSQKTLSLSSSMSSLTDSDYITPGNLLKYYKSSLTPYEITEIINYDEIYYFGRNCKKKINNKYNHINNYGYDDKKNRYNIIKNDHIAYRYEILCQIGKGVFGNVVKTYDYKNKCDMALKIIRNTSVFHRQARTEIAILKDINKHDTFNNNHVIHMKEYFMFRNHICITFELLYKNLYSILKENDFKGFELNKVKNYASQLLKALIFLKKIGIIHCDLKPENILLTSNYNEIKIIDFGSACYNRHKTHTYLQSRYYRAPEVILETNYSFPIDMWSFGCIISEFYTGKPIFPGRTENEQLVYIMEVCGIPPQTLISQSRNKSRFYYQGRLKTLDTKMRNRRPNTRSIHRILKSNNICFENFVRKCLEIDPYNRITPSQAIKDEWIVGEIKC